MPTASPSTPGPILALARSAALWRQAGIATQESLESVAQRVLCFRPGWAAQLLRLRRGLLILLGLPSPHQGSRPAASLPLLPGSQTGIYTVLAAEPGSYWLAAAQDRHLDSWLAFHAEAASGLKPRLVLATSLAQPHGWRGRIYLLLTSPLQALVLKSALKPR
jgi:hypothetical protein